jgi:hypothetical protein
MDQRQNEARVSVSLTYASSFFEKQRHTALLRFASGGLYPLDFFLFKEVRCNLLIAIRSVSLSR